MRGRSTLRTRTLPALALLALVAAACNNGSTQAAGGSPSPHGSMMTSESPSMGMSASPAMSHGMMQPGADKMHAKITSPEPGTLLTGNTLDLHVVTSGYTDTCATAGKPDMAGMGHYHVLL